MSKLSKNQGETSPPTTEDQEAVAVKERHKSKLKPGEEVFLLIVDDKKAWLKKLNRKIIAMAMSTGGEDAVAVAETILENCWLEGDEAIREDDDYFIPAIQVLKEMISSKTAQLKKF